MLLTKVEFMIDDRKLGTALRTLASLGAFEVRPVPVAGATIARGRAVADGPPKLSPLARVVMSHIQKYKLETISSKEIVATLKRGGMSGTSANEACKKLMAAGILRRIRAGRYEVVQ